MSQSHVWPEGDSHAQWGQDASHCLRDTSHIGKCHTLAPGFSLVGWSRGVDGSGVAFDHVRGIAIGDESLSEGFCLELLVPGCVNLCKLLPFIPMRASAVTSVFNYFALLFHFLPLVYLSELTPPVLYYATDEDSCIAVETFGFIESVLG